MGNNGKWDLLVALFLGVGGAGEYIDPCLMLTLCFRPHELGCLNLVYFFILTCQSNKRLHV
jgi:hypothetical protein